MTWPLLGRFNIGLEDLKFEGSELFTLPFGRNECKQGCHSLKPFGLADFTEPAVLQGDCGSPLQLRTLRLASSANSTIAQFRIIMFLGSSPNTKHSRKKVAFLTFYETINFIKRRKP